MQNLKAYFFVIIFSLFLSAGQLMWAQTPVNIGGEINNMVIKYKINSVTYYSSAGGQYHIGRQNDSVPGLEVTTEDTYRTEFKFDLSNIPQNATIVSASLTSQFTGSSSFDSYNIKRTSGQNGENTLWDEISTASTLFSNLSYNSAHSNASAGLVSAIQSCLSSDNLYLSVKSNSEGSNGTGASGGMSLSVTYNHPVSITVMNMMGGYTGGSIGIGISQSPQTVGSPASITPITSQTVSLQAIENQSYDSYSWIWNDTEAPSNKSNWQQVIDYIPYDRNSSQSHSFTAASSDDNTTYLANLRKICNTTFQNNFVGVGNGGNITVNGTSYSSPTSQFQVVEANTITATAQYQEINGIRYLFSHWDDYSTYYQKTFTINNNKQHTAYFIGKPSTSCRNLNFNSSTPGQPIVLSWSEHPNQNVTQYRIWRKIKNGPAGQIIGTVNRGTTNFIDYEYLYVGSGGDTQLQYDVQAYYSTEGTYSDPDWVLIGADEALLHKLNQGEGNEKRDIPLSYKIDNYPNPFNPSTTISYQIPSAGFVTLKVYDILGKEVAELVNENKQAGYYNVSFIADNLPSGIYIYTIQTNGFVQSKKMLFLK